MANAPEHVVEGQPVAIWPHADATRMAAEADHLNRHLRQVFRRGLGPYISVDAAARRVQFNHIAGQLRLGGQPFLIRPKFMSAANWTTRLASWAALGYNARPACVALLPGPVDAQSLPSGLVDLLALHYARRLESALADHPLVGFQRVARDLTHVRGRPLVGRNVLRLPHQRHKAWCSFTRLEPNVRALQLLAWAAARLERLAAMPDVKQRLRQLVARMPVEPLNAGPIDVATFRLALGAWAYREPLAIANAMAGGESAAVSAGEGSRRSASFVLCTFEAFEGVVSSALAVVANWLGMAHQPQRWAQFATRTAPSTMGGISGDDGERLVRPDDVLLHDYPVPAARLLVSDSKYVSPGGTDQKPLLPSASPEHLYQVMAAAVARSADAGLIVQPYPEALPSGRAELEVFTVPALAGGVLTRDIPIGVVRLDLRLRTTDQDPLSQLAVQLEGPVRQLLAISQP